MALEGGLASFTPLPKDYHDLCSGLTLFDVKEASCDFNIHEII